MSTNPPSMNREARRLLRRQGQLGEDGAPAPAARQAGGSRPGSFSAARTAPATKERTSPAAFVKDVRGELRRVAWPTRSEVVHYSAVVLFTLVVLMLVIFALDFVFAKSVLFLFDA